MSIINFQFGLVGQNPYGPPFLCMDVSDNLATITAPRYLRGLVQNGYTITKNNLVFVNYVSTGGAPASGLFSVSGSGQDITLNPVNVPPLAAATSNTITVVAGDNLGQTSAVKLMGGTGVTLDYAAGTPNTFTINATGGGGSTLANQAVITDPSNVITGITLPLPTTGQDTGSPGSFSVLGGNSSAHPDRIKISTGAGIGFTVTSANEITIFRTATGGSGVTSVNGSTTAGSRGITPTTPATGVVTLSLPYDLLYTGSGASALTLSNNVTFAGTYSLGTIGGGATAVPTLSFPTSTNYYNFPVSSSNTNPKVILASTSTTGTSDLVVSAALVTNTTKDAASVALAAVSSNKITVLAGDASGIPTAVQLVNGTNMTFAYLAGSPNTLTLSSTGGGGGVSSIAGSTTIGARGITPTTPATGAAVLSLPYDLLYTGAGATAGLSISTTAASGTVPFVLNDGSTNNKGFIITANGVTTAPVTAPALQLENSSGAGDFMILEDGGGFGFKIKSLAPVGGSNRKTLGFASNVTLGGDVTTSSSAVSIGAALTTVGAFITNGAVSLGSTVTTTGPVSLSNDLIMGTIGGGSTAQPTMLFPTSTNYYNFPASNSSSNPNVVLTSNSVAGTSSLIASSALVTDTLKNAASIQLAAVNLNRLTVLAGSAIGIPQAVQIKEGANITLTYAAGSPNTLTIAASGGASSPILYTQATITNPENLNITPFQLLAAPGANNYYVVHSVCWHAIYPSGAGYGGGTLGIAYGNTFNGGLIAAGVAFDMNQGYSMSFNLAAGNSNKQVAYATVATSMVNLPLKVAIQSPVVGTLSGTAIYVTVEYEICNIS